MVRSLGCTSVLIEGLAIMKLLSIGQIARRAAVGVETVRYYEREGLLERPQRKSSGYRAYGDDVVARLLFIRRAKTLGFTLKEIKDLLTLRLDENAPCSTIRKRAQVKIVDIDARIDALNRMKKALSGLVAACDGRSTVSQCSILESLDHSDQVAVQ